MKAWSFGLLMMVMAPFSIASPATDALFEQYKQDSQAQASISEGRQLWFKAHEVEGEERSCISCHGRDLTVAGKHVRTMKLIEPMSQKVNSDRFKDKKKIEKWFKRNCKWVLGRECTSQEKSNILIFLLAE